MTISCKREPPPGVGREAGRAAAGGAPGSAPGTVPAARYRSEVLFWARDLFGSGVGSGAATALTPVAGPPLERPYVYPPAVPNEPRLEGGTEGGALPLWGGEGRGDEARGFGSGDFGGGSVGGAPSRDAGALELSGRPGPACDP